MIEYMATYSDPDGLPRAWGISTIEQSAREEAKRQLDMYKKEKRAVDDLYLANAEYTLKVVQLDRDVRGDHSSS